jgi:hypothetical protein
MTVATDGRPLTMGTGITAVMSAFGKTIDFSSTNTGLTRAVAGLSYPFSVVGIGMTTDSSAARMITSLATAADLTARVFFQSGAVIAQHIGGTTNASANSGVIISDNNYANFVAVFASSTDVRIYGKGNVGRATVKTATNVGTTVVPTKLAFGMYDGSVANGKFAGRTPLCQWLRINLTDNQAWALVDNPWQIFVPQRTTLWAPPAASTGFKPAWITRRSRVIGSGVI